MQQVVDLGMASHCLGIDVFNQVVEDLNHRREHVIEDPRISLFPCHPPY